MPALVEDDAVLIQRSKANLSDFAELYERYSTRVYRYLLVRVGNVDDAEDLTSQTFLAAMNSLRRYDGNSPFIAWLLGIARHKLADQYRRAKPVQELDEELEFADNTPLPETLVGQQLDIEVITQKLRVISPDRAEAISLRLFAGLEVSEIAATMGKNEASVRMLVYRGLRDLQEHLGWLQTQNQ
jgi:RNA polymerase sigma-70 factor (ECF subfamily)